ncbi:hypothetical protein [Microcoleus sp. FACHB-831]|uniref:hypothetical protein n=1 Tax=Microcoleus sp. FACHB-831 TaxID=2692827 RepID=UPI0016831A48|nr:hypothetical protein [Microcoleus sp. FACHB-831]
MAEGLTGLLTLWLLLNRNFDKKLCPHPKSASKTQLAFVFFLRSLKAAIFSNSGTRDRDRAFLMHYFVLFVFVFIITFLFFLNFSFIIYSLILPSIILN